MGPSRAVWLALALVMPSVGLAGAAFTNPLTDQLVEGHTVFAVLEVVDGHTTQSEEYMAAVAVLVEQTRIKRSLTRIPGVLWFNDQFLTNPIDGSSVARSRRLPCSGAVLATNEGDPDPRLHPPSDYNAASYVESYFITDTNDHQWNIDKWWLDDRFVWSVAIMDQQTGYSTPDDDECSGGSYRDVDCVTNVLPRDLYCSTVTRLPPQVPDDPLPGDHHKSPGDNGMGYPCQGCPGIEYNALLVFFLEDLVQAGTRKDHKEGSPDWNNDASGCQSPPTPDAYRNWPCPGRDDDREGNSHPFNPDEVYLLKNYAGYRNHGGSADCPRYPSSYECHATRNIDIYFGVAAAPPVRNYRVLDLEGRSAPYHCHDDTQCTGMLGEGGP